MGDGESSEWAGRRFNNRALGTPLAAVIMIVVIVVIGGIGYFAFNKATPNGTSTSSTCQPASSPFCVAHAPAAGHDAALLIPFASAQTGSVVPFTASIPGSDGTPSSFFFNFGDGSNTTSTTATVNHVYTTPGTYIVSTIVKAGGTSHDNYHSLSTITVSASFTSATASEQPGVTGSVASNSTSSTAATAILQPGGSVTVSGGYTGAPTNPQYLEQSPTIMVGTGGTLSGVSNTTTTASGTAKFANSGVYWVEFAGSAKNPTTSTVATQNYVFTVFVAPSGVNAGAKLVGGAGVSPHANSLNIFELTPGGSTSEDPAIDYETAGYEPIMNVYENLINYNGSDTGPTFNSYVPTIAACVPGSNVGANNCQSMFGSTLIRNNNYTFVIGDWTNFYDPVTKKSWGVWPTDVMFSIARTEMYSVLPCFSCNNGWIIAQSLLSFGNGTWDAEHGARNNTPQNVYATMTLNGTDCPSAAMSAPYHGCITFNADGNGVAWPYFLELIADPLGASIVPCSTFTTDGSGIPYWTIGNVTNDAPCAAPGVGGFGLAPNSPNLPAKGWDNIEFLGSGANHGQFIGTTQWTMTGSGPYYMNQLVIGSSYNLAANPSYGSNPDCTWAGCWPAAGGFAASVSVDWETSQVPGEEAYQAGIADLASIPSTDTGLLLQLVAQGKIKVASYPGIDIDFMPFNFAFNVAGAKAYTTNPITVNSDVFSYVGLRQFVAHAYPYATIQSTINTKDGIQFNFQYGGAIPQFMANYYPTNVSWPTGDPDTNAADTGGAAWWWAQVTTPSSPYYDPEMASCTTANPCQFPLFGETGAPDLDQRINLWAAEITSLSGGKLRANPLDINFADLVTNSLFSGAYQNAMPLFRLGWAPDYPDPTDYMVPLYYANSSYTASDTDYQQMMLPTFNSGSCHSGLDYSWWAATATSTGVANDCQGAAYNAMITGMNAAAIMPAGPLRVLTYTEVEQIANALALYTYTFQDSLVVTSASWVTPSSIDSNVTVVGYDVPWYFVSGNGVV